MRICCRLTVRNDNVLLDYVRTPEWRLHRDNFTKVKKTFTKHYKKPIKEELHPVTILNSGN